MDEFNYDDMNDEKQEKPVENTETADEINDDGSMKEETPNEPNDYRTADNNIPVMNKIELSPVLPISDYKPASKGLKLFAAVMAAVILLTGTCLAGYFVGRNDRLSGGIGATVDVNLAAKPKSTDQMTAAQVYQGVNKSIVGICVYNAEGTAATASGVIYSKEGYIVTNDHIYSEIGAPKFIVYMYDGSERTATYVAGDAISDLSVLKLDNASGITVAEFGDSNQLVCGESVVAIGRPSSATDDSSITSGIVSLTKRRVKTTSNYSARLVQTDSAINPGSSGGALVNMYGQVVGITSSKLAGVEYDSIGFAIPTTTVSRVAKQLIKNGKVTDRAKLGITYSEVTAAIADVQGIKDVGLYVASVSDDSDLYGKVTKGDIITHVNDIKITNDDIILDVIEDSKAGDTIKLTVLSKKGSTSEYTIKLKANIGESSYSSKITAPNDSSSNSSSGSSGGTFNFPYGE